MSTDLVPRARLDDLCRHRDSALAKYTEGWRLLSEALRDHRRAAFSNSYCSGLPDTLHRDLTPSDEATHPVHAVRFETTMRQRLDRDMWKSIIYSTPLWSVLDAEEKKRFDSAIEKDPPPVTPENVLATIERLSADSHQIFRRGLVNAFSRFCRDYKSNDGFKIGDRIVITGACERYSGGSFHESYRRSDELRDLDRIMHVLDGKPAPEYQQGFCAAMRQSMAAGSRECETPYWRARWFQNGNMHLWATRRDLLNRANLLIAEHYGAVVGDDGAKSSKAEGPLPPIADDFGDFPSPPSVAQLVIELAEIQQFHRVLEPSAGSGNLAKLARAKGADVDCYEIQPKHEAALREAGFINVVRRDFLEEHLDDCYDRVAMNPPFAPRGADIRHVMHAWSAVKPGGRLVAVMSSGAVTRSDGLAFEFARWRQLHGATVQELPEGSFKESGTMVRTVLVVVDKPEESRGKWGTDE